MTDFQLDAQSAFSAQPKSFDGITITAIEDRSIVSIATPNGGDQALATAIQSAFSIDMPPVGQFASTTTNNTLFLRLAQDQMFALFDQQATGTPTSCIASALSDTAYLTDQSDSWAILRIQGPMCTVALERICSQDLNPDQFPPGRAVRTAMEHLGVILICEAPDTYVLLSARSSADNFLDAIETSARNVV